MATEIAKTEKEKKGVFRLFQKGSGRSLIIYSVQRYIKKQTRISFLAFVSDF